MPKELTEEQKAIIQHPLGSHARVLAVAGSGKTSTMVERIHHLVMELGQDPKNIRIVMFNRLAREDFDKQLNQRILETSRRPTVLTFHALAYRMRAEAEKKGLLSHDYDLWTGDKEELALICVLQAIDSLVKEGLIDDVDPMETLDMIGLWKASLIPPERAGHRTNSDLPLVYRRFEEFREQRHALTFDDFVPKALELVATHPAFKRTWTNRLDHLIVDEYQDINYGQQQLVRLLAGDRADVMVVGDDDQTIYEWRAARPHYILQGFKEDFANKTVIDYKLSHTFRFGPMVAQTAYNVISFNESREMKPLVSQFAEKHTNITVLVDESEQATEIGKSMAEEVETLVRKNQVPPNQIVVLGRTFVQLDGLQSAFLQQRVPFQVLGMGPFFERDENRTLVDYVRLALAWGNAANTMKSWRSAKPVHDEEESAQSKTPDQYQHLLGFQQSSCGEAIRTVLAVANTPSRKLARSRLQQALEQGAQMGWTLGQSLRQLVDDQSSGLPVERREILQELIDFLLRIRERVMNEPELMAGELLSWIVDSTGYRDHFSRYYGDGMASIERLGSVDNFLGFAGAIHKSPREFIAYLGKLDPTWGYPTEKLITMTTIHRTKGLQFRYVFIPACVDGNMPVLFANDVGIYDKAGIVPDHPPSSPLEQERRLFYVAVTRTIDHLYIGTIVPPPAGLQLASSSPLPSRFLEEWQYEVSKPIVEALQAALVSKGPEVEKSRAGLERALTQQTGCRSVASFVTTHYLPLLDDQMLVNRVSQALVDMPETPFQYKFQYSGMSESRKREREQVEPPPWSDPWEGIGSTY